MARAGAGGQPRREKPTGKLARFSDARKNNNDLLADCERLLLREAEQPQIQNGAERRDDVIHPSEMAHSDWCPRATYLRITAAREGRAIPKEAHRFQLENIFEEGHEYHRKWQARFRRLGRLRGRWICNACQHLWKDVSPEYCPECGAPAAAIDYAEVGLSDPEHLIYGNADGEVISLVEDEDDVLLEVKSVGEGTVRMELPQVLAKNTYETQDKTWGRTIKLIDMRGVWKDITKPFGPHLKQGLIYLRLRNDPRINRICFLYEFKPTSAVKAFYVTRNDELIDDLWEIAADIVWALDHGGRPPRCIDRSGPCANCKPYEDQESEHDRHTSPAGRGAEGVAPRSRRARQAGADTAPAPEDRVSRARRRPDRSRGRVADGPAGDVHPVGGLFGRSTRAGRG